MLRASQYKIVQADSMDGLEEAVNKALKTGIWQPHGRILVDEYAYVQTLVSYEYIPGPPRLVPRQTFRSPLPL